VASNRARYRRLHIVSGSERARGRARVGLDSRGSEQNTSQQHMMVRRLQQAEGLRRENMNKIRVY
jgi:hypothetical protein